MSKFRVERYNSSDIKHPALVAAGQSHQRAARVGLSRHSHNLTEICLIHGGSLRYETEGSAYTIPSNAVHINQPGQRHGAPGENVDPCTLSWFQVDLPGLKTPDLTRAMHQLPLIIHDAVSLALPHFNALLDECRQAKPDMRLVIDGHLRLLLMSLIRCHHRETTDTTPPVLQDALDYIHGNHANEPRVSDIARKLHVHRSYLHTLFTKHLGTSAQAYIKDQTLKRATQRLTETSESITRISTDLGFATTQHFATAFRKRYGQTPTQFRKHAFM